MNFDYLSLSLQDDFFSCHCEPAFGRRGNHILYNPHLCICIFSLHLLPLSPLCHCRVFLSLSLQTVVVLLSLQAYSLLSLRACRRQAWQSHPLSPTSSSVIARSEATWQSHSFLPTLFIFFLLHFSPHLIFLFFQLFSHLCLYLLQKTKNFSN